MGDEEDVANAQIAIGREVVLQDDALDVNIKCESNCAAVIKGLDLIR